MCCNNPMIQLLIFYDFNCRSLVMRQGGVSKGSFIYSGEGQEIASDLVPKVKLEVVIPDSQVDSVIEAITESAKTEEGEHGDGVIYVLKEKM